MFLKCVRTIVKDIARQERARNKKRKNNEIANIVSCLLSSEKDPTHLTCVLMASDASLNANYVYESAKVLQRKSRKRQNEEKNRHLSA